jgi:hypothetical protein
MKKKKKTVFNEKQMSETLIIVILLVLLFFMLWMFWPKRKLIEIEPQKSSRNLLKSSSNNAIYSSEKSNKSLSESQIPSDMIGSFGTDLRQGTSEPSFKSSTRKMSDNPLSTEQYSRYSKKYRNVNFDVDFNNETFHDVPTLDESWPE